MLKNKVGSEDKVCNEDKVGSEDEVVSRNGPTDEDFEIHRHIMDISCRLNTRRPVRDLDTEIDDSEKGSKNFRLYRKRNAEKENHDKMVKYYQDPVKREKLKERINQYYRSIEHIKEKIAKLKEYIEDDSSTPTKDFTPPTKDFAPPTKDFTPPTPLPE